MVLVASLADAQEFIIIVVSAEGTASPVLETGAHESRADEEDGHARYDGREHLAQSLRANDLHHQ